MDFLHTQLRHVENRLSFVKTEPIDWKLYVQIFAWTVTFFESYLLYVLPRLCCTLTQCKSHALRFRIRQYPLYSKTAPPAALAEHFDPGVFEKSQKYGKDKAKFALFSGLYKQLVESILLQFGFNAWSWSAAGYLLAKVGYGPEYQVCAFTRYSTPPLTSLVRLCNLSSLCF